MANKPKAAGTDAETKVERWHHANGYPYAKKLRLAGAADIGDVSMGDGYPVCIEVKGGQKALSDISGHMNELKAEQANAGAKYGIVISKKARTTKVDDWVVSMTGRQWMEIVKLILPPPVDYDDAHDLGHHVVRRRIRIHHR
jgi:hypothetical protein